MLCFLKIQLGDIHEKHQYNLVCKVTYYNVARMFFLFIAVYIFRLAHRANASNSNKAVESLLA